MFLMLNPFFFFKQSFNCGSEVEQAEMGKSQCSSCVKKDINDKIFFCEEATIPEGTRPHSLPESLRECYALSPLCTHLSDNNHWCDFRVSLTLSEYVDIITCFVPACLPIFT